MVVEDTSWARGRGWPAQDVDVESSLLGGLAEMQDRDIPRKSKKGMSGFIRKRKAIVVACILAVVLLIIGSVFGEMGSSKRRAAEDLSQSLQGEETHTNIAGEWLGWAKAVKKVYLAHKEPAGTLSSDQEGAALRCARSGWQTECTRELFGGSSSSQESELERIIEDRRALEMEYKQAMQSVPEPEDNELRLPAGIALRVKLGVANAELTVCNMPPIDSACVAARGEEVKAVNALSMQLRKLVNEAVGKGARSVADLGAHSQPLKLLEKLAGLIRIQKVQDVVRHRSWRTLDAVSAVILYQVLDGLRSEEGATREDVMLFEGSSQLQYVGGFKGLRYHGQGTLFYPGGTVAYSGAWSEGRMHGQGVLYEKDGSEAWRGNFQDGSPGSGWS